MNFLDKYQLEIEVEELVNRIEKAFERYHVNVAITNWIARSDRIIFMLKLKGDTREVQFLARVPDVQQRLKLPLFQTYKNNFNIFIIASDKKVVYEHLTKTLQGTVYAGLSKKMTLPYVIGHNTIGELVVTDLYKLPHLLVGGSTNSGKTVGLQSLIVSIIYSKSPSKVNLILIDVGAANLVPFDGVPHLSYPVIRDRSTACQALALLKAEMERRVDLQSSDMDQFKKLPRLVLVIDEFPALFAGSEDRKMSKVLADMVSCFLQRGRHAKIHVVLAAQNPTFQNMKVDLGNITARIAFKCAKQNFSETILGEGGAENLLGQGDMYFRSPQNNELLRIQGTFISYDELNWMLHDIRLKWRTTPCKPELNFIIDFKSFQQEKVVLGKTITMNMGTDDKLLADIVIWALGQNSISCNALKKAFKIGWDRAGEFMDRMHNLGVVSCLDAKLPRTVIPQSIEDLSEDLIKFLEDSGISSECVSNAFRSRQ